MKNNFLKTQEKMNTTYILATGQQGACNLDLQNKVLKKESFDQLKKCELATGMVVWDIGCGSGAVTESLARVVGREGLVYALDVNEDQLKITKGRIDSAGFKNVQFIQGDINNLSIHQYKKADIVYSRFLLMHVHDCQKTIKKMADLLKKGGRLSLQESTMESIKEESPHFALSKYYDMIIKYGKCKGFDYNVGRKLKQICEKSDLFSKIIFYKRNYKTTDDIKKLMIARLDELEDKFIGTNLIRKEDYEQLKIDIKEFFKTKESNDSAVMCEQNYILAYKA
ncbi:MAG: class I SAM-dependent methyltransferase [Proteobacteria bacterium]|nr:class I SAM-dependent methyltransferase [Pseudomonadota bacterium]